jgi:hypothetical protein
MVSGKITAIRSIGLLVMALGILGGASNATAQKRKVSGIVWTEGSYCPQILGGDCKDVPSKPVVGTTVQATRNGKKVAKTRTDENGAFTLVLKSGKYELRVKNLRKKISVKNKDLKDILLNIRK